jgi:hypothetical protein
MRLGMLRYLVLSIFPRRLFIRLAAVAAASLGISCKAVDGVLAYEEIGKRMRRPARVDGAWMDVYGRVPVVHVRGTPRDMGRQYGTLLAEPLRALHRSVHAFLGEKRRTRLLAYAERHEQHLPAAVREELQAMSDASGVPYVELVALNVVPKLACSGLAVWGEARAASADGPDGAALIMGRNADYFSLGFTDRGMLVVVRRPSEGAATAGVNFLGMVGAFTGINAHGVAFGNMLVFNAAGPVAQPDGLTIQLAMRLVAEQSTTAQGMTSALCSQRHVIPMNVMLADATEALVLELAVGRSEVRRGERGVLVATNYFRTPGLRSASQPCRRFDTLTAAAERHRGRLGVAEMKKALHAARIPTMNLQAVIFEPAAMRMHVSINHVPASAGPYVALDLRKLFAQPAPAASRKGA